jgi:succinate dehydrogenase / fumarate reductase cytochrome b subunit
VQLGGAIWRWHITMAASILHRAAGMALYGGAILFMLWALSLATGGGAYATFAGVMGSPLGKVVLIGLTLAVFYHLSNGIRHLFWDAGLGFDLKTANTSAMLVMGVAVVLTLGFWALIILEGAF